MEMFENFQRMWFWSNCNDGTLPYPLVFDPNLVLDCEYQVDLPGKFSKSWMPLALAIC